MYDQFVLITVLLFCPPSLLLLYYCSYISLSLSFFFVFLLVLRVLLSVPGEFSEAAAELPFEVRARLEGLRAVAFGGLS